MSIWLTDIEFLLSRWLHIVFMTLIVGGTLFYELVLPVAVEDLKREDKLHVFARARFVFRWVVWVSVAGLLITGIISATRLYRDMQSVELDFTARWALAHMLLGLAAIVIALLLTVGRAPPADPVRWMRLNLVILLVTIFLGSASRQFSVSLPEVARRGPGKVPVPTTYVAPSATPATQP